MKGRLNINAIICIALSLALVSILLSPFPSGRYSRGPPDVVGFTNGVKSGGPHPREFELPGLAIVTNNEREFSRVEGLPFENCSSPHFSRPREKCARSADPAVAGSELAAKTFAPASCCPSSLEQVNISQV